MFEPMFTPLFSSLLSPLIAQPIPITQMDLISNLILQRGVGVATFTRSTIGTFEAVSTGLITTAAIDVARFEANGVLTEGGSTNPVLRNEEFDNAVWGKVGTNPPTVLANQAIAPDGTMTADKLTFGSSLESRIDQNVTSTTSAGSDITMSVYAFTVSGTKDFRIQIFDDELGSQFSSNFTASTGIQRFDFTTTFGSVSTARVLAIANSSDGGAGDIIIWGARPEELPFVSSYIKTIASPVTRGEDTLSIDAANIPAPTENYTVSMEVDILGLDSTKTQTVYSVDGETSRKIEINTTTGLVEATHGAVTSTSTTALTPGTKVKIAFTVGDTNQTLYIDGTQEDQDTKGTVTGTATAISIGNAAGLNQLFGHSKFNKIFAKELTADEVANL